MKTLLLALLPLFLQCNIVYSQDKIEGIGKFKVGKTTTSILTDLERELDTRIIPLPKKILNVYKPNIYEVEAKYSEIRIIKITKYSIANVDINYLSLMFYKDTLCSIKLEDEDSKFKEGYQKFVDAFETKFGKPESKSEDKTSEACPSKKETSKTSIWRNDYVELLAYQAVSWYKTPILGCDTYTVSEISCYLTDNHPLMKSWSNMIKGPPRNQANPPGKKVSLKDL